MHDLNQSEEPTEQLENSAAQTRELPRVLPDITAQKNEEAFRAGQKKVLEMIAANAPLGEILTSLVLLIEAQTPEMLCSVLLLSDEWRSYWPEKWIVRDRYVPRQAGDRHRCA